MSAAALQSAGTLTFLLAVVSFIAWMAGIAAIGDAVWVLGGVFAGSFVTAALKQARR
jgi:hypothetical protein